MFAIGITQSRATLNIRFRDERRDRKSGRVWRIVPKGATLQDPPKIHGASIVELLELLKRPEYRYRYWAKRELRIAIGPKLSTL